MKRWIIPLLIAVLLFVGSTAFGDVNQFELETGLTVDALIFPDTETTVEMTRGDFVKPMPFMEYAVTPNDVEITEMITVPAQLLDQLDDFPVVIIACADGGHKQHSVGVRLKYPLLGPFGVC